MYKIHGCHSLPQLKGISSSKFNWHYCSTRFCFRKVKNTNVSMFSFKSWCRNSYWSYTEMSYWIICIMLIRHNITYQMQQVSTITIHLIDIYSSLQIQKFEFPNSPNQRIAYHTRRRHWINTNYRVDYLFPTVLVNIGILIREKDIIW